MRPSKKNMVRAQQLAPHGIAGVWIRDIAAALDAAEQRGAEREREACLAAVRQQYSCTDPEGPATVAEEHYGAAIADAVRAIRARSES